MPDDVQQTIRTRELRLVDADGNDRAILTTGKDGTVSLKLTGADDKGNLSIAVEKDGRVLVEAVDSDGIQRMKLAMAGNGSHTELSFHERNRKPRMILMSEDKGPAGLFILDQHGKALFSTTP
jgi:hypothetical protein